MDWLRAAASATRLAAALWARALQPAAAQTSLAALQATRWLLLAAGHLLVHALQLLRRVPPRARDAITPLPTAAVAPG